MVIVQKTVAKGKVNLSHVPEEVPSYIRDAMHGTTFTYKGSRYQYGHLQINDHLTVLEVWQVNDPTETLLFVMWNPSEVGITLSEVQELLDKNNLGNRIDSIWE